MCVCVCVCVWVGVGGWVGGSVYEYVYVCDQVTYYSYLIAT